MNRLVQEADDDQPTDETLMAVAEAAADSPQAVAQHVAKMHDTLMRLRRDRAKEEITTIEQFATEITSAITSALVESSSVTPETLDHFRAAHRYLGEQTSALQLNQGALARSTARLCGGFDLGARGRTQNVTKSSAKVFNELHKLVAGDITTIDDEELAVPDHDDVPSKCSIYGICVCSHEGRKMYAMRNAFLRRMKLAFP